MSANSFPDRRKAPRHTLIASVRIASTQDAKPVIGEVKDISFSGCFVRAPQTLPLWAEVRIEINHPKGTVRAVGIVSRSQQGEGMAIVFLHLAKESEKLLREWVSAMPSR